MKIAIVAGGHGKYAVTFGKPGWEYWGVNTTWSNHQEAEGKFTRWFELHRRSYLQWEHGVTENHQTVWLRTLRTLPVYVQDVAEWSEVLTARAFPWKRVIALSKDFGRYHSCSIDWMIAYAIVLGATEIALYGVEQDHTAEPHGSRACVEFWSGFAVGRGIKVWSAAGSTFKLAHLTYVDTPYALDPKWLPFDDETGNGKNLVRGLREQLAAVIDGKERIG